MAMTVGHGGLMGIRVASGVVAIWLAAWAGTAAVQRPKGVPARAPGAEAGAGVPRFEWDPTWPKQPFPNAWQMGGGHGVAVDANDHVFVAHRAADLSTFEAAAAANPPKAVCCKPAPAILEFDQAGNLVKAWGGPGEGFQWPKSVHGLSIDHKGNIWVGGNEPPDAHVLKFTRDGRFLLQIGRSGESRGNSDTANMGQPSEATVDPVTNEVWVADGYRNHRVIAYDADTGVYKRHFGAYGKAPEDTARRPGPATGPTSSSQFGLVHCVKISNDGLVYVCDRVNDRIQVFRRDGTYVTEKIITPNVVGAVANDIAFSRDPAQRFMFVTDHASSKVWILRRSDMEALGSFGFGGHFGGGFTIAHNIASDSKGNLYVTEGLEGKRVQRFLYKGLSTPR